MEHGWGGERPTPQQGNSALDKALGATTDATLRTAFQEARPLVASAVAVEGIVVAESMAGKAAKKRKHAAT